MWIQENCLQTEYLSKGLSQSVKKAHCMDLHAQKEALSVLLTEETLLLENQKNGKGTERTDHLRTGVSQAESSSL